MSFDLVKFFEEKRAWSFATFGPARNIVGVVAHLGKELVELQGAIVYGPVDPIHEELADICLLAIDLSWRAGGTAADLVPMSGDSIEPATAAKYIEARLKVADALANVSEHETNRDVWEHAFRAEAALLWGYAFRALGCDGAPIEEKFAALQKRTWPDWRTVPADQPIEHVREVDDAAPPSIDRLLDWNHSLNNDTKRQSAQIMEARDILAAIATKETLADAARRAIAERDLQSKRGDDFLDTLRNISSALGVGKAWTSAALIERAGQLHDDSVAYHSLRGKLVELLGATGDFGGGDLLDMIADRINSPISESDDEEQIERLERDLKTTLEALHIATRSRS